MFIVVDIDQNFAEVRLIDLGSIVPLSECEGSVAKDRDPGMIQGVKGVLSMLELIKIGSQ